ncbi:unnamed protein product [Cylindrotheca closterium]|uniref:Uncharacterized protein n=1 Tax=Cylindrotheca closterium TaxID=2856 RepID=A0AAD2PVJ1_9STRA|nr:unnamed protein product [Cylindrotheca closterium]
MNPLLEQFCSFDTAEDNIKPLRKPSRSVSFADNVKVFDHWQAAHFSKEELENTWYTRQELFDIQVDCYYITMRMEEAMNGNPSAAVDDCTRGLEAKTPTGVKRRHRLRKEVSGTVLEVQEESRRYLRRGEHPHPEPIARACKYLTRDSEERAYKIALRDHQQAVVADETKENARYNVGKLRRTPFHLGLEIEREPLASVPTTPKNGIAVEA